MALSVLAIDLHHTTEHVLVAHENRVQHTLENVGLVERLTRVRTEHVAGFTLTDVLAQQCCDAAMKLHVALAVGCFEKILLLAFLKLFDDAESSAVVQVVLDLETENFA